MSGEGPDWLEKPLNELSQSQWESLCDGCGKCCMSKLQDSDSGKIYYTNVACKLFDSKTCRCTNYKNRTSLVPECIEITMQKPEVFAWLPKTCAYRLRYESKPLLDWHPLVAGHSDQMHKKNHSVMNKTIDPNDAGSLEHHLVSWD